MIYLILLLNGNHIAIKTRLFLFKFRKDYRLQKNQ